MTSLTGGQFYPAANIGEMSKKFAEIIADLSGQYVLRWATLRRSTSTFLPTFEIQYSDVKVVTTSAPYSPPAYRGDELKGHLYFDTTLSARNVATFLLRASYVPRGVTRIRLNYIANLPFTVEKISYDEGGLCPTNWNFNIGTNAGVNYIEFSSPAPQNPFSALPFATLGKMIKIQFQGVTNVLDCISYLEVDNQIYPAPGGPSFVIDNLNAVQRTSSAVGTAIYSTYYQDGYIVSQHLSQQSELPQISIINWIKNQAATNPLSKSAVYMVNDTTDINVNRQIYFNTETNRMYQIEVTDSTGVWKTFTQSMPGNGEPQMITDSSSSCVPPRWHRRTLR